jgi:peptidoglycan/LPS O-acetylase OafA/YrhL
VSSSDVPEDTGEASGARSAPDVAAVIEPAIHERPSLEERTGQPRPRVRTHIEGFDLIRVLSAFNVVSFHVLAISNGLVGRGSVAAFVMIAAALPAMRPDLGPFGRYARRRAARILVPWLVWSAVYGLFVAARYLRSGIVPPWTVNWLLVGTYIHLWFFIFILVAGLAMWWMLRFVKSVRSDRAALGLLVCAAPLVVLVHPALGAWEPKTPFGLWTLCFPALLIGLALGIACRDDDERRRTRCVLTIGAITLGAAMAAALTGSVSMLLSYGIPALLIPGALLLPIRVGPVVRAFAGVSMGIYAAHPLVLIALRHFTGDTLPVFVSAPLVFLSAAALAALIRRVPGGTWIA